MNAMATTKPVVAEVNIGKVMAAIWLKFESVVRRHSPAIGVGDEADRGVERKHRLDASEMQGVEGQMVLEYENEKDDHRHDGIRRQHMDRIGSSSPSVGCRPAGQ